jgi:hydroxymethylglutaryl-CoA lyase
VSRIEIVEVGPRDGLQNEAQILAPAERVAFIRRLEAAGARRIEAASFVNPKRVPQMADAEAVMAGLPHEKGRTRIGLVLNERGWDRCVAAGCDEANVVVCASEGFALKNQGSSVADQVAVLGAIMARRALEGGPRVTLTISVAFGDPYDGEVSEGQVTDIASRAHDLGVPEIALGDTIGVADPWTVQRRIQAVRTAAPHAALRIHFHDTRNTAIANAFAAIEAGVTILDASVGGLGGCPFAPGASGNVATEDLVYALHRAGFETGYDLAALIAEGRRMRGRLGRSGASALGRAGAWPR